MKKTILFAMIALGALVSSCKSPMMYSNRTGRSVTMPVETWGSWTTADLQVSPEKVRITVSAPSEDIAMSAEVLKENAIGELLEKHNADVLVNPLYKFDYVDGRLVSLTVSGYPAKHTNFRNISFEEQSQYIIEKEKAKNSPQIVINGGEIKNEVAAPAPAPAPAPAYAPAPAPAQNPAPARTTQQQQTKTTYTPSAPLPSSKSSKNKK